jgi:hypothetical protein
VISALLDAMSVKCKARIRWSRWPATQ